MSDPSPHLEESLRLLPHGKEFRFLDSLSLLEPGKKGIGHYTLKGDEAFLRGHFPGQPILPAVIMVEALAQLGGVVCQSGLEEPLEDMRLTAMRNVKVFGTAEPGESITIHAKVTGRLGAMIQIEGSVQCGDRRVMTAQVTLSGREPGGS